MILKTVTAAIFVNFILITSSFSQASDSFLVDQQPVILENTHQRILNSEINGIGYKLYVSLPASYNTSNKY